MIKRMKPLLGTFVEIGVADIDETFANSAINKAFSHIETIEQLLSFQNKDSELSRLNLAHGKPFTLHPHSRRVLRLAKFLGHRSYGAFNPTVAGQLVATGSLPDHGFQHYARVGLVDDIVLRGKQVQLKNNVLVTLDGIAKGYAVDIAVKTLQSCNVDAGWVNAGGDVRVFGDCRLSLMQRGHDACHRELGTLQNAAAATSIANAQIDRDFPSYIVEPRAPDTTGATATCTVTAPRAWLADALTKVACLTTPQQRDRIIAGLGGEYRTAA